MSAFLGVARDTPCLPPYLRVLGMTPTGQAILRQAQPSLPLALRAADFQRLGGQALSLFQLEAHAGDLYGLALPSPPPAAGTTPRGLLRWGFKGKGGSAVGFSPGELRENAPPSCKSRTLG